MIASALTSDPEFRGHVVTQVAALRPELGGLLDDPQSIEVADPAEENFPYAGRTEFTDPETGHAAIVWELIAARPD